MKALPISILACLLGLAACSKKATEAGGEAADAGTPVQVAPVKRQPIHSSLTAEAILYPVKQASIVPKISAPVQRFLVQRGDHVREGQPVAILENRDLAAAAQESKDLAAQAEATFRTVSSATIPEDLTKANTDVQTARQTLDAAKKVYDNRVALFKEGALAQKLVDDAKVAMVQAQGQFDTAQQHLTSLETVGRKEQLKGAQATRDAAQAHSQSTDVQLSYATVRSPVNGLVADRPINVGEMASAGSALISVMDISEVIARANVPVKAASELHPGMPATISGPGGASLTGKVTVVSPAVDPNTTTVEVWVQAKNPGEQLKPGVTVQISVDAGEIPDALVVPAAALLSSDDGGDRVMVAGSDSIAHEHKVKTGIRQGDDVQIVSGVNEGEQVIVVGALGLDDKAKIAVEKPGDAKDAGDDKGAEK